MSSVRCPSCGTEQAPDSRFCRSCGQPLVAVSAAATASGYVEVLAAPDVRRLISSDRIATGFAIQLSQDFPLIADTTRWWAGYGYAAFALILAVVVRIQDLARRPAGIRIRRLSTCI